MLGLLQGLGAWVLRGRWVGVSLLTTHTHTTHTAYMGAHSHYTHTHHMHTNTHRHTQTRVHMPCSLWPASRTQLGFRMQWPPFSLCTFSPPGGWVCCGGGRTAWGGEKGRDRGKHWLVESRLVSLCEGESHIWPFQVSPFFSRMFSETPRHRQSSHLFQSVS